MTPEPLAEVVALPSLSTVVPDERGEGRALRVTWHQADDIVVLSIWLAGTCRATVRVRPVDVPDIVDVLVRGLAAELATER